MTWDAHCAFKLPLREGVDRPAVEEAVRSLTDYFGVHVSPADLDWKTNWLHLADQALSVRFQGKVSEDFGKRVLDPTLRALEPLAATPVAIAVFDRGNHEYRSPIVPTVPRLSKTVGRTAILPQLQPVQDLVDAALQAAAQLPATLIRAQLLQAVRAFSSLRTTQGCSVEDVIEEAAKFRQPLELDVETARALLFKMDELTETADLKSTVYARCEAEDLIVEDPTLPDHGEWEAILDEFGLDGSFCYNDDQVREYTRQYRAAPDDAVPRG